MSAIDDARVDMRARIDRAATFLRDRLGEIPHTAIVLGSGLGAFVERLSSRVVVPYADVPHWPRVGVSGHAGQIVAGRTGRTNVIALAGRAHLYEGHDPDTVAFGVRVLARAGVRTLIVTNAAGGINPRFTEGTLMVIDDHINFTGRNPLAGPNDPDLGSRFPDMSEVYSRRLRHVADEAAKAAGIALDHGVYIGVLGPCYETPAEIRAFRVLGADAVGMSTVTEVIAARHMGAEVLGISCIANAAASVGGVALAEADVLEAARRVERHFADLVEGILDRL